MPALKLSDICLNIVDCEHKTAPVDPNGAFFAIGTPAMRGHKINFEAARSISAETFRAWTRRLAPEPGDLLFAREAPVGPIVRIPTTGNIAPGQRTVLLRPDPSWVESGYLYYLFTSPRIQAEVQVKADGSTVPHLNVADVRSFELPSLPPLDEQRAIAATLGALDDKIESNQRKHALTWDLLAAEWEQVSRAGETAPLGDLVTLAYGKALPAKTRVAGDIPVYGSSGVTGWHNLALVGGPSVIVGRKGTVGKVYWSHVAAFPIDTTFIANPVGGWPLLACFFALGSAGLSEMNSDSAVPGLNRDRALASEVVVPDVRTAEKWASRHGATLELVQSLETEIKLLTDLRDVLLSELLSGRIRVPEAQAVAA